MSFYDCLRRFQLLSGLEGEDLSRFSDLCREALAELKTKLKVPETNLSESQCLRLSYVAGALAFYKYCLYIAATQPQTFEAGEVKVIRGEQSINGARKLFEEECKGVSDILCDSGFYFGRIRA